MTRLTKSLCIVATLLFLENCFGENLFLKRRYPYVENGVYQLDRNGAPIKIVDVNYGHVWKIPKSDKGVDEYAVIPKKDGIHEFSKGTNIIYGTTQKIYKEDEPKKEMNASDIRKEISKNKKKGIIQNVASVNKKSKVTPKAMYIDAKDVNEEEEKHEEEEILHEGQELGEKIKNNIESHYERTKEPSPLSIDILDEKIPKSLEELMQEDLNEQKWLSQKPASDKICFRDYSKQCPSSWEPISDTQCRAPSEYDGPCARIMKFEPMTAKEKSELAKECKVNWSCINESCGNGKRDYTLDCPLDWTYNGRCVAPKNYNGGCDKVMDFGAYTEFEKEEFSSTCKAIWPCKEESCERDYTISCPEGWSYDVSKDVCIAPEQYKEICSEEEILSISHMSFHQRMSFSTKYGISWPCKKSCTYAYDKFPCPKGWTNIMNSGICKAPEEYKAPYDCPSMTHFDYMSVSEKEEFSRKCHITWICEEQSLRDYSKCPLGFSYLSTGQQKGFCKPTKEYTGPCQETQDILSVSQEQKYKFEAVCNAPFPELKESAVPQSEQDTVLPKTIKKLLKGTDTKTKGITLE